MEYDVFTILMFLHERILHIGAQCSHNFGYFCQSSVVVVSHVREACEANHAAELIIGRRNAGDMCRVLCVTKLPNSPRQKREMEAVRPKSPERLIIRHNTDALLVSTYETNLTCQISFVCWFLVIHCFSLSKAKC